MLAIPLLFFLIRYLMFYHSAMNLILVEHRLIRGWTIWLFFVPVLGFVWLGIFIILFAISLRRGTCEMLPNRTAFFGLSLVVGLNTIYLTFCAVFAPQLILSDSGSWGMWGGFEICLELGLLIWHFVASYRELNLYAQLHGFTVHYGFFK